MKAASASRLASARFSQRIPSGLSGTCATLGADPLLHHAANLGRRGKLSPVSFRQRLAGFLDLPLVHLHIFADRFRRHKRAAAALRLRQTVQPLPQLGFQAYRHYRGGRHDALLTQLNTSDSTMSRRRVKRNLRSERVATVTAVVTVGGSFDAERWLNCCRNGAW